MNVPMVDLKVQYNQLRNEIDQAIAGVLDSTHFILGPVGKAFEESCADYLGTRHALGVASGTDALQLALMAAGIGPGDEVITTAFTFIATAEAIAYVGATPVFVDIDPQTFNIDSQAVADAITPKTRALMPVHLFGQPADLAPLQKLCEDHGLIMIEDCAQSFGADYQGQMTGSFGALGCYSFFPSKNLGCFGDGGLVVTSDDDLAEKLTTLRNHGSRVRYYHSIIGVNSRLDEIQAAILGVKLKYIDRFNSQRRENAHYYSAALKELGLIPPFEDGKGTHVYHQYTLLAENRDEIHARLGEAKIASAIYYPVPLHRQEVFAETCAETRLPVTERIAEQVLSLPMYPELTQAQMDQVLEVIGKSL